MNHATNSIIAISRSPKTVNNTHESCYRSYQTLALVKDWLKRDVPPDIILSVITEIENAPATEKAIEFGKAWRGDGFSQPPEAKPSAKRYHPTGMPIPAGEYGAAIPFAPPQTDSTAVVKVTIDSYKDPCNNCGGTDTSCLIETGGKSLLLCDRCRRDLHHALFGC